MIDKCDYNEYGYRFRVMQWKRVGPLVELVCELTEYEPDLEMQSIERKVISHMIFNKETHLGYFVFTIQKTWG